MRAIILVGRKIALKFLEEEYNSPNGQLIVVYGFRRISRIEYLA